MGTMVGVKRGKKYAHSCSNWVKVRPFRLSTLKSRLLGPPGGHAWFYGKFAMMIEAIEDVGVTFETRLGYFLSINSSNGRSGFCMYSPM